MLNPFRLSFLSFFVIIILALSITQTNTATLYADDQQSSQPRPQTGTFRENELIVTFKAGTAQSAVDSILEANGTAIDQMLNESVVKVTVDPERLEYVKNALSQNPDVVRVDYNHKIKSNYIPSNMFYSRQWHLPDVQAPVAWDTSRGDSRIIIAILDSGVDITNPYFSGGKVINGYNFVDNTPNATSDQYGHGTMVAGIAAAPAGNGGVVGVCPNCSIMSVVIADKHGCSSDFDLARGIRYSADHGAKVINISYSGSADNPIIHDAVNYAWNKGSVIVSSAGNESSNAKTFPAAYANVLAVSATGIDDKPADFTDHGTWIDVSAPGVGLITTGLRGKYAAGSGTSFAAPIIAGLAGLICSANPSLTNAQVVNIIKKSSDNLGNAGFDEYYGFGKVNLQKALAEAMARPDSSSTDSFVRNLNIMIHAGKVR